MKQYVRPLLNVFALTSTDIIVTSSSYDFAEEGYGDEIVWPGANH